MQFINLHLDQTADNKFVVTDNVSTLRGEGETVEEAIGRYLMASQNAIPIPAGSIVMSSGLTLGTCEHDWHIVSSGGNGFVNARQCFKCGLIGQASSSVV